MADTTATHWTVSGVAELTIPEVTVFETGNGDTYFMIQGAPERETVAPTISNMTPAALSTIARGDSVSFRVTEDASGLGTFTRIVVMAIYGSGATEIIHNGDAFTAAFDAASTKSAVALGFDFVVIRDAPGWRDASLTLRIIAIDSAGNEATPIDYAFTVSDPAAAPVVDTFSPADGSTITRSDSAAFHVTDEAGTPARVMVAVVFADGTNELVHDGTAFVGAYTGSTRGSISNGYSFSIVRSGNGWRSATIAFKIYAFDTDGNVTASTSYDLTVSNPAAAPVIGNFSPADASTISRSGTPSFDVTDEAGTPQKVLVGVEFADGQNDIIHDGVAFVGPYAASSTRVAISNGYTFTIARTGGWRSAALAFKIWGVDADGSITSSTSYNLTVSDPAASPTIDNFDPADGSTILLDDPISFDVADELALEAVYVSVVYSDGTEEVIYDGSDFTGNFDAASTFSSGTFTIYRDGGWKDADLAFKIHAVDGDGNITDSTDYNLTVSNPDLPDSSSPVIGNYAPADASTITHSDTFSFDVTDDSGTVSLVQVFIEQADDSTSVVYDGTDFIAPYDAASTVTPIGNGFSFSIDPGPEGWPQASFVVHAIAADASGNIVTDDTYNLFVSDPQGDTTPPVIENDTPADGSTILGTDPVQFDITDDFGTVEGVLVLVTYPGGSKALVYADGAFESAFTDGSEQTSITGGIRLVIAPNAGWPLASFTLNIQARDASDNEVSGTLSYTVSNPTNVANPQFANFDPSPDSDITSTQAISFDVTDPDSGQLFKVWIAAYYPNTGVEEVVHDGEAFRGRYQGKSSIATIDKGYHYSVKRAGGWPGSPTFRLKAADLQLNESD